MEYILKRFVTFIFLQTFFFTNSAITIKSVTSFLQHNAPVTSMVLMANGHMASADEKGVIHMWNPQTETFNKNNFQKKVVSQEPVLSMLEITPAVLVCAVSNKVILWNIEEEKSQEFLCSYASDKRALVATKKKLYSIAENGTIDRWRIEKDTLTDPKIKKNENLFFKMTMNDCLIQVGKKDISIINPITKKVNSIFNSIVDFKTSRELIAIEQLSHDRIAGSFLLEECFQDSYDDGFNDNSKYTCALFVQSSHNEKKLYEWKNVNEDSIISCLKELPNDILVGASREGSLFFFDLKQEGAYFAKANLNIPISTMMVVPSKNQKTCLLAVGYYNGDIEIFVVDCTKKDKEDGDLILKK